MKKLFKFPTALSIILVIIMLTTMPTFAGEIKNAPTKIKKIKKSSKQTTKASTKGKKAKKSKKQGCGKTPLKKEVEEKQPVRNVNFKVNPEETCVPLKLNLDKCVKLALESHPDIKIARAKVDYARGQYNETKSSYNMKFDLQGGYMRMDPVSKVNVGKTTIKLGDENNFSGKAILEKVITTFGNLENLIAASALNILSAEENYLKTRQDVLFTVKKNYFNVLRTAGRTRITRENLDIVRQQLKITNDMYDAGIVPLFEIVQNKLYLSRSRQALTSAEKSHKIAISALLESLKLDINLPVKLNKKYDYRPIKVDLKKAQELAHKNRYEIKSLDISLKAAQKILLSAQCGRNPTLSFQSTIENKTISGLSTEPTTVTSMLVLSIPLSDGGESYAKIEQAKASIKELKETLDKTTRLIELEVKNVVLTIWELESKLDAARQDLETARIGYNIALARYENGISTSLELNNARRLLNETRINYNNVAYEYLIELANLEKVTANTWKE
ncbi:MAG: TolC family protein [Candidatus Eremiobacteraeota bacterium]|nr:TolC family protein [Candidatus Eremiobacteraeota bacterium]